LPPAIKTIFLHGLESNGQGRKARLLRSIFPELVSPDFTGTLEERMAQLEPVLAAQERWNIVGSSFGGLMAALWCQQHSERIARLILLAPALHRPEFAEPRVVATPTLLVHGTQDTVVPPGIVAERARRAYSHLTIRSVEDDHRLQATSESMNWRELL